MSTEHTEPTPGAAGGAPEPAEEPAEELAEELRISIARLSRRLRTLRPEAAEGGVGSPLPLTQFAALAAIERHGSMTPRELADHEKVQPPSMTRVIAHLEEQELVVRSPHPTDGRQVVLQATGRGSALLAAERRRKEAWLSRRLGDLTEDEREILHRAAPIIDKLSRS